MIVYGGSLSPYVRKVMVFGAEKGIELAIKNAGMGRSFPEFEEASPFGKMPGFRDGDFAISDSSAIVAYLEAIRPEPALIPAEPKARARTIWFDEFADTILRGTGRTIFFNRVVCGLIGREGDLAAAAKAEADEMPGLFDYLERVIPDSGFLVEDRLTLADISVVSPLINLSYCGVGADAERHPRTAGFVAAMRARPSFARMIAMDERILGGRGRSAATKQSSGTGIWIASLRSQ